MAISKKQKRLWIIAVSMVVIIAIVLLGVNSYLGLKIKAVIESEINKNSESAYSIRYDNIGVNIYTGSFHINDLIIEPQKGKKDSLKFNKKKSSFSIKIKSFKVNRVHILDFLETKKLHVANIKVDKIDIELLIDKSTKQVEPTKNNEPLNILTEGFKGVLVNDIHLINVSLKITDINKPDKPLLDLHSISFEITDILLDSTTVKNPIPVSMESFSLKTKDLVYNSLEYYTISSTGFDFILKDSTLKISNFNFVPKYSKAEYNKRIKYENDLFSIKTKEIILHNIQLHKLFFNRTLHLPSLEIISPDIDIYRDKRKADAPYKEKPLIASLIKKIPLTFKLDTLKIIKGNLLYGERNSNGIKPGEITFKDFSMSGYNITNDELQLSKQEQFQLDIISKLMGTSRLKVNLQFDQKRNGDYFTVNGELRSIKGQELNPMTENLMQVKIQSGDIKNTSFHFKANNDVAIGEFKMEYENLKIKVINSGENKEKKTLSFLANELIKTNNIAGSPKYKTGIIHFTRDKNKGFPNYLWKSIQSGLVSIVAPVAESKNQKEIRKKANIKKRQKKERK